MSEYTGRYFSEGPVYRETALLRQGWLQNGLSLYEVIRVQEGICLFLEDHIRRLQESLALSGQLFPIAIPGMRRILDGLIRKNGLYNGNIKLTVYFSETEKPGLYAFFILHHYPPVSLYQQGIDTDLFRAVRPNPNVKRLFPEMRERLAAFISAHSLYEALLVNEDGCVTEGSKSNVFFIQGDSVYTPPGDQVLKGITRNKVIELCNQLNIKFMEKFISTERLRSMEAAFLTGTSPKVLPIRQIGTIPYRVPHPVMNSLMKAYENLIAGYIQRQRRVV
jgi:branched-chain amino acid aminotransferase